MIKGYIKGILITILGLLIFQILVSCNSDRSRLPLVSRVSPKDTLDTNKSVSQHTNAHNGDLLDKKFMAQWNNPVMNPMGIDICRMVRGYFLVGDFDKMLQFVIVPPCYSKNQIMRILRKSTWGYSLKYNNVEWLDDHTFVLSYRTEKNKTVAVDQYIGRVINDTAKLILFPEKEDLFPYYGDESLDDLCK
ncbi:MAG: hypothetical protein RL365_224 [Bacteroidota bacterium]